jgi:hypothetical protein
MWYENDTNGEMLKNFNEAVTAYLKSLYQHMPDTSAETHVSLSKHSW